MMKRYALGLGGLPTEAMRKLTERVGFSVAPSYQLGLSPGGPAPSCLRFAPVTP